MSRPRRPAVPNPHAARVSGDRWLFGYADIVTLLLACFASLYAAGLAPAAAMAPAPDAAAPGLVVDPSTAPVPPATTDTVLTPVEDDATAADASGEMPSTAAAEVPASELELAFEDVVGDTLALPGVEMTTSARGLVISLPEAGSFPAGRAHLSAQAEGVMLDLADRLRDLPNVIRVEGHTDDVPIATPRFASNWELSTARATRVVEFLIEQGNIDPARLSAAGYAEHRPRRPNVDASSRARNRRVDIVVLDPDVAGREEPTGEVR